MYDILNEFGRVFWKGMTLDVATKSAREQEPFFGAYQVVPYTGASHGEKVSA